MHGRCRTPVLFGLLVLALASPAHAQLASVEAGKMPANPDWSTFADGHKEVAICDAVLASHKAQKWVNVT